MGFVMTALTDEEKEAYLEDIENGSMCFSNKLLIRALFPYVQEKYPEAVVVEVGDLVQYICINKAYKESARTIINQRISSLKETIDQYEKAFSQIE